MAFQKKDNKNAQKPPEKKVDKMCYFCVQNLNDVSPRDTMTLRRFVSSFMKIAPRRRTGLCAGHQRKVSRAIKVSRELALLPYTPLQQ
jgi:small subunit ribosomal protein S18